MKKPIIGIIAPQVKNDERPFQNYTKFISNFPNRIKEAGGIPIGLLFKDDKFDEDEANLCDGFVIQGGINVSSVGINTIKYALENKKPLLGICLGMQTMAAYEWINNNIKKNIDYKEIDDNYKLEYEDNYLSFKEGHNNVDPFYIKDIEKSKHTVNLEDGIVKSIFKTNKIKVPSLHKQIVIEENVKNWKTFKVTGKSKDGVIEVIEPIDKSKWIVGVQFHPEIEKENLKLFEELIKKARK